MLGVCLLAFRALAACVSFRPLRLCALSLVLAGPSPHPSAQASDETLHPDPGRCPGQVGCMAVLMGVCAAGGSGSTGSRLTSSWQGVRGWLPRLGDDDSGRLVRAAPEARSPA